MWIACVHEPKKKCRSTEVADNRLHCDTYGKNDVCVFAYVSNGVRTQGAVKGFEKVGSAGISNKPKMQGGFNFEFLNVASALERAAEALYRESARMIS